MNHERIHDNADVWSFLAEGKMHIVVSNLLSSPEKSLVLRVPKYSMTTNRQSVDQLFIENQMVPWYLTSALSKSYLVELSSAFINKLILNINEFRPINRKSATNVLHLQNFGYLEFNYNNVFKTVPRVSNHMLKTAMFGCDIFSRHCISFDFKVKSGMLGTSPFIASDRSLKLTHSKFHLMQLHKLARKIKPHVTALSAEESKTEPAWGVFHAVSQYNPCDLCSMDANRVRIALTALIDCPQNNLRVCLNGQHVFGWDKDKVTAVDLNAVCCQFLGNNVSVDISLTCILNVMTAILCAERTLSRLEQMQSMDLLDVEGAALIFGRLVDLLDHNHEAAVQALSDAFITPMEDGVMLSIVQCIAGSEENCAICPSIVAALASLRISSVMSPAIAEQHRLSALFLVAAMTVSECLLLLTMWMLALVAKDTSVIVALQRVGPSTGQTGLTFDDLLVQTQTQTASGLIGFKSVGETTQISDSECQFAYCLSLVDIGLKTIDKVWNKAVEEQELYLGYELGAMLYKGQI